MPHGGETLDLMTKHINSALKKLLTTEGVPFGAADGNIGLLRRYLTRKGVKFSFMESEDQLFARVLGEVNPSAGGGSQPEIRPIDIELSSGQAGPVAVTDAAHQAFHFTVPDEGYYSGTIASNIPATAGAFTATLPNGTTTPGFESGDGLLYWQAPDYPIIPGDYRLDFHAQGDPASWAGKTFYVSLIR